MRRMENADEQTKEWATSTGEPERAQRDRERGETERGREREREKERKRERGHLGRIVTYLESPRPKRAKLTSERAS